MENKEENISFAELYNNSIKDVKLGKTVTGKIIEITSKGEIFVDLGYKADGIIPRNEYSFDENDNPKDAFKVGDTITADVLKQNDGLGNVLLSYKKAKIRDLRNEFETRVNNNEIFEKEISEVTDKGFIVNYEGMRVFIPISLSGLKREENIDTYKGKKVKFKIIEYNPKQRRIIGSVKLVKDEEKEAINKLFWDNVEIGKEYEGKVTSISSYGAFVDIGGVQGLLHVSEMSWNKNANPNEILEVNQIIKVKIKDLDIENKRIKLAYEDKGVNPWDTIEDKYNINDIVKAEVVKLMPFGAFVKLDEGIEGLVHISQICEKRITKPEEVLKVGQHVNVKILDIDKVKNKMELSIKELEGTSNEYIEEM